MFEPGDFAIAHLDDDRAALVAVMEVQGGKPLLGIILRGEDPAPVASLLPPGPVQWERVPRDYWEGAMEVFERAERELIWQNVQTLRNVCRTATKRIEESGRSDPLIYDESVNPWREGDAKPSE